MHIIKTQKTTHR